MTLEAAPNPAPATHRGPSPVQSIFSYCRETCPELIVQGRDGRQFRLWPSQCNSEDCPLYPFRLGENPNRKGIGGRSQRD